MTTTRRIVTNDEAADLIQDALRILAVVDPPSDLRAQVFGAALSLVGQREIVAPFGAGGIPILQP